jgi:hypothetical protein
VAGRRLVTSGCALAGIPLRLGVCDDAALTGPGSNKSNAGDCEPSGNLRIMWTCNIIAAGSEDWARRALCGDGRCRGGVWSTTQKNNSA